jgi:hypothetical protein
MDKLRINQPSPHENSGSQEPEGLSALRQAREQSDAFLRAADEAIQRVLSRNSERFLQEARQHGGQ